MSVENEISKMEAICSRREYCTSDISEKLKRKGIPEEDAAKILQALYGGGFLDDARYARAFARDKSSLAGWGTKKIAFMLRSKGIMPETVNAALEEIDEVRAASRLHEVLSVKWKMLQKETDMQKKRNKALCFAVSRGYSFEEALAVLKVLENRNR